MSKFEILDSVVSDGDPTGTTTSHTYPYRMELWGGVACLSPNKHALMHEIHVQSDGQPDAEHAIHRAPAGLPEPIQDILFGGRNHGKHTRDER